MYRHPSVQKTVISKVKPEGMAIRTLKKKIDKHTQYFSRAVLTENNFRLTDASQILGPKSTNRAGIRESNFPVPGTREKERSFCVARH